MAIRSYIVLAKVVSDLSPALKIQPENALEKNRVFQQERSDTKKKTHGQEVTRKIIDCDWYCCEDFRCPDSRGESSFPLCDFD